MKTTKILTLVVLLLAVSTTFIRANEISFPKVSSLTNYLKKTLDAPSDLKETKSEASLFIVFEVNEKQELEVLRFWSYDLSKKDMLEVEMQLIELENRRITFTGNEKQVPVKISYKIW